MSDVLVKAEGVTKKFCKSIKHLMFYGMADIGRDMLGMSSKTDELRSNEFWANENISFELRRGECLGLIGPNGTGKSTLLKILSGIISPDKGQVEIRGRVGALIQLGAGFHPILTGRENIYINGSILGFSKKEIDKKFDKIVDFAELQDFIDTPVKHYSSGMHVRLGFAIAAQMEPDVLLIDEVLAVGDAGFRAKSFNAITEISRNAAVIFVSHTMPMVARICSKVMVMAQGQSIYQGEDVPFGIEEYFGLFQQEKTQVIGKQTVKLLNITINGIADPKAVSKIYYLDDLVIELEYLMEEYTDEYSVSIAIFDKTLRCVAQALSRAVGKIFKNSNKKQTLKIIIPRQILNVGTYSLSIHFVANSSGDGYRGDKILTHFQAIRSFKVGGHIVGHAPIQLEAHWEHQ